MEQENQQRLQQALDTMNKEGERRKRTEARLLQLNARFNALIQAIPDSVYLKDFHGKYLFVNASFEKLVGKKSAQILGQADQEVLLPHWLEHNPQINPKASQLKENRYFEIKEQDLHGRDCYLDMVIAPVKDEAEGIVGSVGMIRDVTAIRLAELEHLRLNEQVAQLQKMEAIGALAGGVAHDLNNILTGLISYPELLILGLPPNDPLRKPLFTIQKAGQMAADIVQDLLILARRGAREKTSSNLNTVVKEYIASPVHQKMVSENPGISVRLELAPDLMCIAGTASDLGKTVMNLVINAFEAMSGLGLVVISTENYYVDDRQTALIDILEGEYVRLCVRDNGKGIPPELHARIFEPFFSKKELRRSGSGLGLAVVWGTVQDHDGHVNVISSVDKGTCFELYFPVNRQAPIQSTCVPQQSQLSGAGHTVLVVDDIGMQREIATEMLKQLGYEVNAVASGEAAIDFVRKNPVDLLLLDMIMEGMDGLDTYKVR